MSPSFPGRPFAVFALVFAATLGGASPADATPFAYVPNRSADNISVIDTATNGIVATIQLSPCCQGPSAVAMSPSGHRAYVVNDNSGSVSVIDTATNTVTATVTGLGNALRAIAVNGAGTRAYVTAHDSSRVNVLDTATNTILTTIPLASNPNGVVVSTDGTRAYTGNTGSSVTVIDTATNTVAATVALPSAARGLAVSPSGQRLYVTEPNANALAVIDTVTNTQIATVGMNNSPWMPAVRPDGARVYVAHQLAGLAVVDANTNTLVTSIAMGGQSGVAVRPDGTRAYAVNYSFPSSTSVVDTATNTVVATIPGGSVPSAFGQFIGPFCPSACNDGNPCTTDGCNLTAGCLYTNNVGPCPDEGNACTADVCNGLGSCGHPPHPALTPCDDGLFCTGTDTCDGAGACNVSTGDPCTGGSECADLCNEASDNCFDPAATGCTDDGNVCSDDVCDGAGACTHPANAAPCPDGIFCNGSDTCAGGICTHAGDPCTSGTECSDLCNEGAGNCFDASGSACTADGNPCTLDQCDGAGSCGHPAGNAGAECRADAGQCDVAEVCDGTSATCPADVLEPDGTTCDDGAMCTIADQCVAGACAGSSMTCGDGTTQGGCGETCDDGNLTADDGCSATCTLEPCEATPSVGCRTGLSAKGLLKMKIATDAAKNQIQWKWGKGAATLLADFGDPTTTEDFHLCIYDNGALVSTTRIPAGDTCEGKPCWKAGTKSFQYKDKARTPDGAQQLKLQSGADTKAQAQFKGAGGLLDMPALGSLTGPVVVQLQPKTGTTCWAATFSATYGKNDATGFVDKSD